MYLLHTYHLTRDNSSVRISRAAIDILDIDNPAVGFRWQHIRRSAYILAAPRIRDRYYIKSFLPKKWLKNINIDSHWSLFVTWLILIGQLFSSMYFALLMTNENQCLCFSTTFWEERISYNTNRYFEGLLFRAIRFFYWPCQRSPLENEWLKFFI